MGEKLTHWKQTMNPDYLGAWALQPGQEPILTITAAGIEKVVGSDGKKEECLVIRYREKVGPGKMIVNATNSKTIEKLAGTPYIERWPGTQIQVYVEKVKAFGDVVDAIRIRPFKPKAAMPLPKCNDCEKEITPAFGKTAAWMVEYTMENYKTPLCAECAQKRALKAQSGAGEGQAE